MFSLVVPFMCSGRNHLRETVLTTPVSAKVAINLRNDESLTISFNVDCPFNTGGHSQRCKAAHPDQDKFGVEIFCPYTLDIPHVVDNKG